MSRIKDVSNIKNFVDTIDEISSDVDTNLNTIKGNLTELGISSSTFNKTNLINGLRNDPTIAPINTTDNKGDVEKISGSDYYEGMPLNASLLKLGVSGRDPEDPATIITSNNNSRTLTTDRTDGNTTTVKRWATRCAFKFRSQDYGYDRCVYEIPTQYLMEGCVGTEGRHATTFSKYPYPEEIIMISSDNDKNFIHFVNAQYLDGHYNYYNGTAYNLMIVKDRTNWGVLNDAGTEFKKYISVYANNIEDSLAFYIEDSSGIGYITFPMPDRSFGDELLNTLWDCKVIWRSDAPDRDFNVTVEGEYREEYVNEINPTWTEGNVPSSQEWFSVCYGNGKYVAIGYNSNIMAYSTDGINWTQGNMPSSTYWWSVCYGNDKFVAVTYTTNIMAYSTDGINWTKGNMPSSRQWTSVCYGNGKYVAVAYNNTNIMAYSTDGISWTQGTMPSQQYWRSVCYGNGKFVANSTNIMAYSTDGISWTQDTIPSSQTWYSVCYGNGKFVAVGGSSIMAYGLDAYSYPSLCYNKIEVEYAYPLIIQESVISLSINEPENYYFQIIDDNSRNQVFIVPFPSSSNVQYLRNNYSRLFHVDAINIKNLFVFASFYRSSTYGGLVLYVSPDLIHWNVHQLIPGTATSTEVNTLIGTMSTSLSLSNSNATIMENALRKYVGFLPNGQYIVMYPYEMYKQSGDNKQNMAVLYSPYQSEPLMTINDPYGDEDWENKAINGISAIVDNYGCFDIYYNNRLNRLNCPLSLGLNELLNVEDNNQPAGQPSGVPVIVKAKNSYTNNLDRYRWNLEASTAPGVANDSAVIGGTKDINAPMLATAICTLDKDSDALNFMPVNVRLCSAVGNYGSGQYKSITLLTKQKTSYAGNIDEDMSNYITEFYNHAGVTEYKSTEYGISFIAKNFFAYIPTDDEIANNQTIARITVIGDTASNYMQSQTAY